MFFPICAHLLDGRVTQLQRCEGQAFCVGGKWKMLVDGKDRAKSAKPEREVKIRCAVGKDMNKMIPRTF